MKIFIGDLQSTAKGRVILLLIVIATTLLLSMLVDVALGFAANPLTASRGAV